MTYYVSASIGNNSRTGAQAQDPATPWLTISHAAANAPNSARIEVMAGTYHEVVTITKTGQTVTAYDTGNMPQIDGYYGPKDSDATPFISPTLTMDHPRKAKLNYNYLPDPRGETGYISGGLVVVKATNVTLSYLYIRRSAGSAVQASVDAGGLTVDNCKIDFSYAGTFAVGGLSMTNMLDGVTITNNKITRSSMRKLTGKARYCEEHRMDGLGCTAGGQDPNQHDQLGWNPVGGADSVDVCIKPKFSKNVLIAGNVIAFCYGEGIAAAAGIQDVVIEDNTVHDSYHWGYGINCAKNVVCRRNVFFTVGNLPIIETASAGFNIGDEVKLWQQTGGKPGKPDTGQKSQNVKIYNCLSVGATRNFEVRTGQYVTRIKNGYVGFNTWVGRTYNQAANIGTVDVAKLQRGGELASDGKTITVAEHYSFLYENNVHIRNGAKSIGYAPTWLDNVTCRNNAWTDTPVGKFAGAGDVVGYASVENAVPQNDAPLWVFYDVRAENCDPDAHSFNPGDYYLAEGTALVGAASNGSPASGVTPAVTDDFLEHGRGTVKDIGFFEYGVEGGSGSVAINFTQKESEGGPTVDGGVAPYDVWFDDTSVPTGVTINERRWDFGDGDSALDSSGAAFKHSYREPGIYQAKLTIWDSNGRKYVKLGQSFTVTGDGGVTGAVYVASVSQAIGTGAVGTHVDFSFGSNLNGNIPRLVIFTVTKATATGSAVDDASLGYGMASGTDSQFAAAMCSQDNQATTVAGRQQRTDCCILVVDQTGAVTGSAKLWSAEANKVTVEITDSFPASYLVTATAYAGDGVRAKVGNVVGPLNGGTVPLEAGFEPTVLGIVTANSSGLGAAATTAALSVGYATAIEKQLCVRWHEAHGQTQGSPRLDLQNAVAFRNTSTASIFLKLAGFTGTGASLTAQGGDYNIPVGWFMLALATRVDLRLVSTPTQTGDQDITLGWQPGHLLGIATLVSANTGSFTSSQAGPVGHYTAAGTFERTNSINSQYSTNAADSANTFSYAYADRLAVKLHNPDGSTSDALVADASFLSTGYRLAWSTVQSTARRVVMLAVETAEGQAPDGPVVSFTVTPTSGPAPLEVVLDDTSDGNGASILGWVVSWGDGSEDDSSLTRPTALAHTYEEPGSYDVTVTVSNANGSTPLTKARYVTALAPKPPQLVGPLHPIDITEETENEINLTPTDPTRGQITHRLNLGAVRLSADYTNGGLRELAAVDGKWQFAVVDGKLRIMDDQGNLGTVNVTWDDGAPPPADSGTEHLQISSGNQDGHELNDGSVTLTSTTILQDAGTQEAALRFGPVNIPQGATITSAILSVYVYSTSLDDPDSRIHAENVDNATVLDTTTNFIQTTLLGAKTTAYVDWTATGTGIGWKSPGDLKTVVQPVISRTGWASGNYLNILWDANGAGSNLRFYAYDYGDHTYGAKLDIVWVA